MTTDKRFFAEIDFDNTIEYISDTVNMQDIDFADFLGLANELHEENQILKATEKEYEDALARLKEENRSLKKEIQQIHIYIDNAILTERTRMGKMTLKQLREGLQK